MMKIIVITLVVCQLFLVAYGEIESMESTGGSNTVEPTEPSTDVDIHTNGT